MLFQARYKEGDLVKIAEDNERHIGIIEKVILDGSGKFVKLRYHIHILLLTVTSSLIDRKPRKKLI